MNIEKLPKGARDYIKTLERERTDAIRTLNQFEDEQTPSRFFVEEWACTGENSGPTTKVRYVQTDRIRIKHDGHCFELAIDHGRLRLRAITGMLVLEMDSGNTIKIEAR